MRKTTVTTAKFPDSIKFLVFVVLVVVWVTYKNDRRIMLDDIVKITTVVVVVVTNNTNVQQQQLHNKNDDIIILRPDPVLLEPILSEGIMYTICGPDRSGNVIADLLYAHAFAFGHNITYGGSCCLRPIYPTITTKTLLQSLGWDILFPFRCPNGVDSMKYRHLRIDGPDIVQSIHPLLLHKDTYRIDGNQSYLTTAWRRHVETILKTQRINHHITSSKTTTSSTAMTTYPNNNMYEIAVHVRRGDVSPCTHPRRYLPNSHYIALIDQYTAPPRNLLHDDDRKVHVTIYSESDTFEPLDIFMERNYTLELDTADLGQIWKALATADVVILSRSTFSIVPAILNPNIVVATEFMNFDPHHVRDGEFDVHMMDGWHQADLALVHASDQIIHDMVQTQC